MATRFSRALADEVAGDRDAPLYECWGADRSEHEQLESLYLQPFTPDDPEDDWLCEHVSSGPMLDVGAGVGRHTLFFQDRFASVAIESDAPLISAMRERGVHDARQADMFDLPSAFERDRFATALVIGTQVNLTASMDGLRAFLGDLARITTENATAILDSFDPTHPDVTELPGYRADPTPGLAHRTMQFEYESERGKPLLFRLFSPERVAEATIGTDWSVHDRFQAESPYYRIALTKQ
ncbi:class I SAM-dependent methyltransferase [Halocatena halophila]|uniref:class I SAM-dependent methyltransferase n=1 Tax=Halocatena halophila TaxID=2814576 RepID=UPI002ED169EE